MVVVVGSQAVRLSVPVLCYQCPVSPTENLALHPRLFCWPPDQTPSSAGKMRRSSGRRQSPGGAPPQQALHGRRESCLVGCAQWRRHQTPSRGDVARVRLSRGLGRRGSCGQGLCHMARRCPWNIKAGAPLTGRRAHLNHAPSDRRTTGKGGLRHLPPLSCNSYTSSQSPQSKQVVLEMLV